MIDWYRRLLCCFVLAMLLIVRCVQAESLMFNSNTPSAIKPQRFTRSYGNTGAQSIYETDDVRRIYLTKPPLIMTDAKHIHHIRFYYKTHIPNFGVPPVCKVVHRNAELYSTRICPMQSTLHDTVDISMLFIETNYNLYVKRAINNMSYMYAALINQAQQEIYYFEYSKFFDRVPEAKCIFWTYKRPYQLHQTPITDVEMFNCMNVLQTSNLLAKNRTMQLLYKNNVSSNSSTASNNYLVDSTPMGTDNIKIQSYDHTIINDATEPSEVTNVFYKTDDDGNDTQIHYPQINMTEMRVNIEDIDLIHSSSNESANRYVTYHVLIYATSFLIITILLSLLCIVYYKVHNCEQQLLLYRIHMACTETSGCANDQLRRFQNTVLLAAASPTVSIQSRQLPVPLGADNVIDLNTPENRWPMLTDSSGSPDPIYETVHRESDNRERQTFSLLLRRRIQNLKHLTDATKQTNSKVDPLTVQDVHDNYVMPNPPNITMTVPTISGSSSCDTDKCIDHHGPESVRIQNLKQYNDYVRNYHYDQISCIATTAPIAAKDCATSLPPHGKFSRPSVSLDYITVCDDPLTNNCQNTYCDMKNIPTMFTFKSERD